MKSLSYLFFIIGIVFIVVGYMEVKYENEKVDKIEYRFIPENIYSQQFETKNLKRTFSNMFNNYDPSYKSM